MMKYIKIILLNILFICILYQAIELFCFFRILIPMYDNYGRERPVIEFLKDKFKELFFSKYKNFEDEYGNVPFDCLNEGEKDQIKKPVIVFGCSFADGYGLKKHNTFSYKLSELTGRRIYLIAKPGWCVQDMLWHVKRNDFYEKTIKSEEPEKVIYIYIGDHIRRLYMESCFFDAQVFYRKTRDGLKKSMFCTGGFLYGYIAKTIRSSIKFNNRKNTLDFLFDHFVEIKKEASKHWKNTKYYIFIYSYPDDDEKYTFMKLKDEGYNIIFMGDITAEDLSSSEYILPNDSHPNEKAWELLTPLIAKETEL